MPKPVHIADDLVPIGQFKGQASRYLRELADTDQRLVITQNGRAAAVVMSPREYDRLQSRQALLEEVAMGITDLDAGRTVSTAALRKELAKARRERKPK